MIKTSTKFLRYGYIFFIFFIYLNQPVTFSQLNTQNKQEVIPFSYWKPYNNTIQKPIENSFDKFLSNSDFVVDNKTFQITRRNTKTSLQVKKLNSTLQNAWKRLDGPTGGSVRRFYKFNNILYATTDRDLFRYKNQKWNSLGINRWSNVNLSLYINHLGWLLLGTDWGLYYSDDDGASWKVLQDNLYGITIWDIIKSGNGEILLASSKGLYKSKDDGASFTLSTLVNVPVLGIDFDNSGNIWAATNGGVYKARYDSILNWKKMELDTNYYYKKVIFDSKGVVYTYNNYYVYQSTDSGLTWNYLGGSFINDIMLDDSDNLFITGMYHIYIANMLGVQFTSVTSNIFLLNTFLLNNNKILVGSLGAGVLKYNVKDNYFSNFSNGMNAATIRTILPMNNGELLVSTDNNAVYVSKDNGTTWKKIQNFRTLLMKVGNDNTIYAALNGGISKSTDYGRTWKNLNLNVLPYFISAFDISDDDKTIYAGSSTGELFVSTDGGENFIKTKNSNYVFVYFIKFLKDGKFLVSNDSLYITKNDGINLTSVKDDRLRNIKDIVLDNDGYIYLATFNKLFRSLDGTKWYELNFNKGNIYYLRTDKFDKLYVVTSYGEFDISSDRGNTWLNYGNIVGFYFLWSFAISNNGYLFAGTQDHGLYKQKIKFKEKEIPSFSVTQNFPNPFNSRTRIEYEIPAASFISIKIYDILGREIITLVSDYKEKGSYFTYWDATNYSSGIYFYRISANGFNSVQKMILLR